LFPSETGLEPGVVHIFDQVLTQTAVQSRCTLLLGAWLLSNVLYKVSRGRDVQEVAKDSPVAR
jgi:hypothetical protein